MDLRDYSYQQIVAELERRKAIQNSQNNNEDVMSPIVGEIIKVNRNAVEEEHKKTEEECLHMSLKDTGRMLEL